MKIAHSPTRNQLKLTRINQATTLDSEQFHSYADKPPITREGQPTSRAGRYGRFPTLLAEYPVPAGPLDLAEVL